MERNLLLFGLLDKKILHAVVDHIRGQVIRVASFFKQPMLTIIDKYPTLSLKTITTKRE